MIQVSQAFKLVLNRSSDCVARYGGEEFGFILPNTTTEGAQLVAQRIHDEVLKLELAHEKSIVSEFITVSIGIISYIPTPDDEMESAVALADSACIKRNQTVATVQWCIHTQFANAIKLAI